MKKSSNNSGIHPVRDMVLVLPEEEVETEHGLIKLPEYVKQREILAQVFGKLIALGEGAFKYEEKNFGAAPQLELGDRVMFAKYGGIVVKGKDGVHYRMIRDDDILAVVEKEVKREVNS